MLQLAALPLLHLFFPLPLPLGVIHALLDHVGGRFVHAGADLGLFAVKGGREGGREGGYDEFVRSRLRFESVSRISSGLIQAGALL